MKGTVSKSSIIFDRNHRLRYNFSILFENAYFHQVENLRTYSLFVFEIFNKILLGALGFLLSIYYAK